MNISYPVMKKVCTAEPDYFTKFGEILPSPDGLLIYKDNGSSILAIAHLDFVNESTNHFFVGSVEDEDYVFSSRLDDRLGVYTILSLLPSLGFNYDILLTDSEEIGKSTAKDFQTEKKYNWMFSFDREGDDVVRYRYDSKALEKRLKRAGFLSVSRGSNSDIDYLHGLGCEGFNVGTGLISGHSAWARANMGIYAEQIERFALFYKQCHRLHFKHTPKPITTYSGFQGYRGSHSEHDYLDYGSPAAPVTKGWATGFYRDDPCVKCHGLVNKNSRLGNVCNMCERYFTKCPTCTGKVEKWWQEADFDAELGVCKECSATYKRNVDWNVKGKCARGTHSVWASDIIAKECLSCAKEDEEKLRRLFSGPIN